MDRGFVGSRIWMWARWCLLVGVALLVLSGCNQPSVLPSPTGPSRADDAQQILRIPLDSSTAINTLDPALQLNSSAGEILELIWPTLVTLDTSQQPQPWAAESVDVSSDGLTYTFHLHQGLTFSDGEPLDAAAFAYSLNRLLSPCTGSQVAFNLYALKDAYYFHNESCRTSSGTTAVSGPIKTLLNVAIDVSDPQTLVLKLQQPSAYFLAELSSIACAAVPQQLISRYGTEWTRHLPGGTGFGANLFTITSWVPGHSLVLDRNPHFWGTKPLLREIQVSLGRTTSAAYTSYLAGQMDVGYAPSSQYGTASQKKDFHAVGDMTEDYFAMSWKIAPFNDVRMRQAFALALDKQSLVGQVFQGTAAATNNIVPDGVPGYNPALTGPDGKTAVSGDVVKARQLEQSYVQDTCSGQVSRCPPVTLTVASGYPQLASLAKAALAMWQSAFPGYPVSVNTIDYTTFLDDLVGNVTVPVLQFWATFWVADYPDPQNWLSEQFLPTSAYNSSNVLVSAADTFLIRADGESDQSERLLDYQHAEQLLVDQVAWIPLDQEKLWWETAPYLQGFQVAATGRTPLEIWQTVYMAKH
jgi:oligopeptide transport system substrate-binding protein